MVLTVRQVSGSSGGTEFVSGHPSCIRSWRTRCSSESDRRLISSALILSKRPVGGGYDILQLRRIFVIKL